MEKNPHIFIFHPGEWLGQGVVTLSSSPEKIMFSTKWKIKEMEHSKIDCIQIVQMQGVDEQVINHLTFLDITDTSFTIELKNAMFDHVFGKGIIDSKRIAWEFRNHHTFEGFEVYELNEKNEYMFHAEYASFDQYRNVINGRIWEKI